MVRLVFGSYIRSIKSFNPLAIRNPVAHVLTSGRQTWADTLQITKPSLTFAAWCLSCVWAVSMVTLMVRAGSFVRVGHFCEIGK